jgi:FKBP-type peptidyl-prolyl cis-trans isomerase FklB
LGGGFKFATFAPNKNINMKKMMLLAVVSLVCTGLFAQAGKKPATNQPVKKSTSGAQSAQPNPMKSASDSLSYAIGLSICNFYKSQGITGINSTMVLKALNDFKNNKPMMNDQQAQSCIMGYMQSASGKKAEPNKKAGVAFLEENKKKDGVITLPSGLQYKILTAGTGPKPTANDKVKCHYAGSLIDGKVFESSYNSGQPVVFGVGQVIRGWTEALQLMPTGSKWRLFIPSDMAYGDSGSGPIPPGSTLIFDVELIDIEK